MLLYAIYSKYIKTIGMKFWGVSIIHCRPVHARMSVCCVSSQAALYSSAKMYRKPTLRGRSDRKHIFSLFPVIFLWAVRYLHAAKVLWAPHVFCLDKQSCMTLETVITKT